MRASALWALIGNELTAQDAGLWLRKATVTLALPVILQGCSTTAHLPDPLAAGWLGEPVCERLHEDGRHRVLRCDFAPGVGHERHFHAAHFGYAITAGRVRITDENGDRVVNVPRLSSVENPGVAWHEILNIGDTTLSYLVVERKEGANLVTESLPENEDAMTVSPQYYSPRFENAWLRVAEYRLGPGESEPMHTHRAGVVHFLNESSVVISKPDGKHTKASVKRDQVVWRERTRHAVHNDGDTDARAIAIGLK